MGKQKTNIFTVAECVPNWFEASRYGPIEIDINAIEPNRVDPVEGLRGQTQPSEPATVKTNAGQLTPERLQSAVEADGRPTVGQLGEAADDVAVGATPVETGVTGPSAITNVALEVTTGETGLTRPPTVEEVAGYEEALLHAFWELLEAAGYETW